MYYLLTENFKDRENELVGVITATVPVKQIRLLGSTLLQRRTETVFMPDAPSCRSAGHYYLLVIPEKAGNTVALQDQLENACRQFMPVTILVMQPGVFTERLLSGDRFARTVHERAVLLHGEPAVDKSISLPEIKTEHSAKERKLSVDLIKSFFAGAELFILRKEYRPAAFMLHQCAEHSLRLILKEGSGLEVNTHNIEKLLRYCSMVNYSITEVMPRTNPQQEYLFQLLQKAYIHTRYKDDYIIDKPGIEAIKNMVARLILSAQKQS